MNELQAKVILRELSRKATALSIYNGNHASDKAATAKRRAKNRQARKSRRANRG